MRNTKSTFLISSRSMIGALLISSTLSLTIPTVSFAQASTKQTKEKKALDPSDIFFQAHLKLRNAEKLEAKQNFKQAWKDYKSALTYYSTLKTTHPLWKPEVIDYRIKSTTKLMMAIKPNVKRQLDAEKKAAAGIITDNTQLELDEVKFTASPELSKLASKIKLIQNDLKASQKRFKREVTLNQAHLAATEGQLALLKKNNQANPEKAAKLKKEITRTKALISSAKHYQNEDQQKIKDHLKKLERQLAIYSSAPLIEDVKRHKKEVAKTTEELRIVSEAMLKYKAQKDSLVKKLNGKHQELTLANNKIKTLTDQLKEQSNISTKVVKALHAQLKQAEKRQIETDKQLAEAKRQIVSLTEKLDHQTQLNGELQDQLKNITEDRNRLALLIQQNPDQRIKTVIKQNLALIQQLKETKETLKRVTKDQGSNQDRLIIAERDLAIAKHRILDFQKHQLTENRRVKALEKNLQEVTDELAQKTGSGTLTPIEREELISLRKVAKKLLNKQRFINKKYEMVKKTVLQQDNNPTLIKMFHNDINEQVVTLTEKEKGLISKRTGTITLDRANRMDPTQARATEARLKKEVSSYLSVTKKLVSRGRYQAAKEILQEANELLPNNFPTLINLGCVSMEMRELDNAEQHLKDGIIMKPHNPKAHYLLGMCHFYKQDDDLAEKSLKHSLSLDNSQSYAHFHLGVIAGNRGSLNSAEEHFSSATRVDPDFAMAHFALSVNHLIKGDKKKAQDSYQKALKAGLTPNKDHEKKLGLK